MRSAALLFTCLAACVAFSLAIQCYSCTSDEKSETCGNTYTGKEADLVTCADDVTGCLKTKVTGEVLGATTTITTTRSCASSGRTASECGSKTIDVIVGSSTTETCTCQGTTCNSASGIASSLAMMALGAFFSLCVLRN